MDVSVVVPLYNEQDNVALLYDQLNRTLDTLGSTDGTADMLRQIALRDFRVKVVRFRRNYGQTAAMQAGLQSARYEYIVTLDGDLQNDPADIPMMLDKIQQGYDLVHGWRKNRQDPWLNRRLPSMIANWLISKATGFPIHDLGCTLKVVRREIAQELELYGEMHRFIPILAYERGARCAEVVTRHHARRFGKTKYGISRTFRVLLDLITVKYMLGYSASPMKLFGMVSLGCGLLGVLSTLGTVVMKLGRGVDMTGNPLLILGVFSMMVAIQFLSLGLLGEVSARIYFGSQKKQHFAVRERINFQQLPDPPRGAKAA